MKIEELKKIIKEEIEKALNEAALDADLPEVAIILKSILPLADKKGKRKPEEIMAVFVRDGILYLGQQIENAQAMDIQSQEFKEFLSKNEYKNISAVGDVLNRFLGMENIFVNDFVASLKQLSGQEEPNNTDDVSTVAPDLDVTKR